MDRMNQSRWLIMDSSFENNDPQGPPAVNVWLFTGNVPWMLAHSEFSKDTFGAINGEPGKCRWEKVADGSGHW